MSEKDILKRVDAYYTEKLRQHGATPLGVDWNSQASQEKRFDALLHILPQGVSDFSLGDFGCGYGALYDYLQKKNPSALFSYRGYDLSFEMLEKAKALHLSSLNAEFIFLQDESKPLKRADYFVASGIFNVKLDFLESDWLDYIFSTLDLINQHSMKGFSFNLLTSYSDLDKRRETLFYADPCFFFDACKKHYGRNVALLHDYDLYEFTLLVKKI